MFIAHKMPLAVRGKTGPEEKKKKNGMGISMVKCSTPGNMQRDFGRRIKLHTLGA